jgi:two-component system, cell cycle sensor histidine kinase and response regulator CckA
MRDRDQPEATNERPSEHAAEGGHASGRFVRHSGAIAIEEAPSLPPLSLRKRSLARAELEAALFRASTATSRPFAAVGASGVVLHFSAGAQQLLGYAAEDVVGQSLSATFPAIEQALGARGPALRAGRSVTFTAHASHRAGDSIGLVVRAVPATDDRGEVLALVLDLQTAPRPHGESTGATTTEAFLPLGAQLRHDLNNVLTAIQVYAGFVAASGLSPEQRADLEVALSAARQGASLLSSEPGAAFGSAGASTDSPQVIDVKDVVRHADETLRQAVGAGVEVAIQLPLTPLPVRIAADKIESLLLSLALNARDAMEGVGTLSLVVGNTTVGPAHPLAGEVPRGAHAVISMRDTGSGMSPETQARIFEPFFTSKPRNESSGLGLVVARTTVEALGGAIRVQSELGHGSEFQVFLPLAVEAADHETEQKSSVAITVLVVEDDAAMRSGLRRILGAEGYDVLEAANGTEAAELAARHAGPIQVLLSDLTLPGADGRDALTRVRNLRPDISAVFVSGRLDKSRPLPSGAEFVQKPFATAELLAALTRATEKAPPTAGRLISASPVVLIVDDDDALREAFARVIEECEFKAIRAKSGLHALQVLEQQYVDVVICDQFMPGMDGVQLLEVVRERFPHHMRILFTAFPSSDVVVDAVNRGGVHKVLVKSMHAVAIRDEIERAVLSTERFRTGVRASR